MEKFIVSLKRWNWLPLSELFVLGPIKLNQSNLTLEVFLNAFAKVLAKLLPKTLCDGIMKKDMDKWNLVNHKKLHRTSFIRQKYLAEITGTLINWSIKKFHHTLLLPNFVCQTFGKGFRKASNATKIIFIYSKGLSVLLKQRLVMEYKII